ncbi:MAG: ComEC/Rec2 family competence protein [Opitutaceae bacterium]|nr:ComEC/Rec2 family competence protein [Opitutaceae bacterium]
MLSPSLSLRAPLLWLLLPFMAGLAASRQREAPPDRLGSFAAVALVLCASAGGAAWRSNRRWARLAWPAALLPGMFLAGYVYLPARQPPRLDRDNLPPREVTMTIEAELVFPHAKGAPSACGTGRIVSTEAHLPELAGQRVYFSVIRRMSTTQPVRSGGYVIHGVLESLPREPEEATFQDYLANLGVRLKVMRARIVREEHPPRWFQLLCGSAANRCEAILRHGIERHPDATSVYLAMLLGSKAVLTPEQQNAFLRSGTFHIFSVGGLHVGVIALAVQSLLLLVRLPRAAGIVAGLGVLWIYVQVTGGSAPAIRSFIMIAFYLGGRALRLPGNALAALAAAALVTLLWDPQQLFSTGFQMSYAVVMALIVMGLPLAEKWQAAWRPFSSLPKADWRWWQHWTASGGRFLLGSLATGWAALLASIPPAIGYFHLFSPGAMLANIFVLPVSSLAIIAGFASLLAGMAGVQSASLLFNHAAALLIKGMDAAVRHGSGVPGVCFPARFAVPWLTPTMIALMAALMLLGLAARWSLRYGGFWPPAVTLAAVLFFVVKFG